MSSDPLFPIFVCAGCILAVLLVYNLRQRIALNRYGLRTTGEIVELKIQGLDFMHRYPVVRFQTRTGQWVTVSSSERVDDGNTARARKSKSSTCRLTRSGFGLCRSWKSCSGPRLPACRPGLPKGSGCATPPNPGGAATNNHQRHPNIRPAQH